MRRGASPGHWLPGLARWSPHIAHRSRCREEDAGDRVNHIYLQLYITGAARAFICACMMAPCMKICTCMHAARTPVHVCAHACIHVPAQVYNRTWPLWQISPTRNSEIEINMTHSFMRGRMLACVCVNFFVKGDSPVYIGLLG